MKRHQLLINAIPFLACSGHAFAQKFDQNGLETTIQKAIGKAYAASVRIWGFDVVRNMQTSGQFSGVVVSADGHILTAAHVNTPGQTYKVMFPDGTSCIATGLGEIELAGNRSVPDVAMMKITGQGKWAYAEMGWSSVLKKDEPCISIAYPESLNQSRPDIRFGYIAEVENKYGFIRSTCIMEPGDSGGPLFDYLGRVIGLHSAVDVSESDNFEVPVDLYRKYWSALNIAKTYTALPALTDSIGKDPMAEKIVALPGLENPESTFHAVIAKYKGSAVRIKSYNKEKAQLVQGTVLSTEGMAFGNKDNGSIIVSKSSLVGNNPVVEINNNLVPVTVLKRDQENDLVLLQAASKIKGGIKYKQFNADTVQLHALGKFLISCLADGTCRISIKGSGTFSLPKKTSSAYFGAEIGFRQGWVMLRSVKPNSPAAETSLKQGDQILEVQGAAVDKPDDLVTVLQKCWPGDKITIKVLRPDHSGIKDTTLLKEVILGTQPQIHFNHPAELFAGGKSTRRDGFAAVFAHDAKLYPEQCGGPVFDAEGHFYGINIARYSRTGSIVIPAAVLLDFITH